MVSLFFFILTLSVVLGSSPLYKVLLPEDYVTNLGTRCLDGSPSGYYIRPSNATFGIAATSWVFYLQGGGLCIEPIDCYTRTHTIDGSSNNWNATYTDNTGVLSTESFNPFSQFNHVYVPYCSGDTHTGTETTPNHWGVYFAGHLTLQGIVMHLKETTNIVNATNILLNGGSAGGIGVFNNADWFSEQFPNAVVKAAAEAGYFFPKGVILFEEYILGITTPFPPIVSTYMSDVFKSFVDENCAKANQAFPGYCWDAGTVYPYISTPMFIVNNLYDMVQLEFLTWVPLVPDSDRYLAYFGSTTHRSVLNSTIPNSKNGYFLVSCFSHTGNLCMASKTRVLGYTYAQVLADWFFEKNQIPHRVVDECWGPNKLPCNPYCPLLFCED